MCQIMEVIAEIEKRSVRLVNDAGEEKAKIFAQIQKEAKEFDAEIEEETNLRLQALRGTLEGEMEVKLSEGREAFEVASRRLTEHYEKNHKDYIEQLFRGMTGV